MKKITKKCTITHTTYDVNLNMLFLSAPSIIAQSPDDDVTEVSVALSVKKKVNALASILTLHGFWRENI